MELKKPCKSYETEYPQLSKELQEQFYSCESYYTAPPPCQSFDEKA